MVTYYIGNVREKRNLFRKYRPHAACVDNSDVLADFKRSGKVCFVLGAIPYGTMRIGQYLAYARALKSRVPLADADAKALLRKAGLRVRAGRRMRTLPRDLFRGVQLAAAIDDDTREVWLNYDGIPYSPRARARMRKAVRRLAASYAAVHVSVSDYRFVPRDASVLSVTAHGTATGLSRSASRRRGRIRFTRAQCKTDLALSMLNGKPTVWCDN